MKVVPFLGLVARTMLKRALAGQWSPKDTATAAALAAVPVAIAASGLGVLVRILA